MSAITSTLPRPSGFSARIGTWIRAIGRYRPAPKVRFADLDLLAMSPHLKADLGLIDIKDPLGRQW